MALLKMLIVEDDELYRMRLKKAFSACFEIHTCPNYEGALLFIQNNNYDVVLTDDVIPQIGDRTITTPRHDDYRGSAVAEAGKNRAAFVIGMSFDDNTIEHCDLVLKKPIDMPMTLTLLKKQFNIKN